MTAVAELDEPSRDRCLRALSHYELGGTPRIAPLGDGLINETYLVEIDGSREPRRAVLQRVSPIFGRAVHDDIEAITAHLFAKGLPTPRLFRTRIGELSVDLGDDGIWRLQSFISGVSHKVMTRSLASPAGELVGGFHAALSDLRHDFHFVRAGAHDLALHIERLRLSLRTAERPDFQPPESAVPPQFFALGEALLRHADRVTLRDASSLPRRLCHGDLKLNNLRFDEAGRGVCLLDLDTLAYLPLAFELGDAFRSWCNPLGEDVLEARFDLELFEQALVGYAAPARAFLTADERASIVAGIERITYQLAVRFAVDVVEQRYFRWNATRFPSRASHNLMRALGQWSLCQSLGAQRAVAEAIVERVFR